MMQLQIFLFATAAAAIPVSNVLADAIKSGMPAAGAIPSVVSSAIDAANSGVPGTGTIHQAVSSAIGAAKSNFPATAPVSIPGSNDTAHWTHPPAYDPKLNTAAVSNDAGTSSPVFNSSRVDLPPSVSSGISAPASGSGSSYSSGAPYSSLSALPSSSPSASSYSGSSGLASSPPSNSVSSSGSYPPLSTGSSWTGSAAGNRTGAYGNNGFTNTTASLPGSRCPVNGALICSSDGLEFGLCNWGRVVFMPVAAGTKCRDGQIGYA